MPSFYLRKAWSITVQRPRQQEPCARSVSPPAVSVSAPWPVRHKTNQPVYPQRLLKVLSVQVVLPLAETEPEKRT
jgi:hypothetical protein